MNVPDSLGPLVAALNSRAASDIAASRTPIGTMRRASVLALLWSDGDGVNSKAANLRTIGPSGPDDGPGTRNRAQFRPTDAPDDLRLVAIEKTEHLRRHAGQVAFPGGRIETDESPVAAALREASEEVGIEPGSVSVLGELPPASVMASGFDVHTVVGWWRRPVALRPVDVGEVAAVHQLRLSELVDPANRATWVHPSGHTGPVFLVNDLFVWGLTGHLISGLLELAGWTRPWDATRELPIPERFFRGRHL